MLCKKPFNGFGCGQCLPCRINMRRVWTSRIMFESAAHADTGFFTLTYDDDHVPRHGDTFTLDPDHLKNFWKKLRNYLPPRSFRYYACGEYGHEGSRQWNPHYHAAAFGYKCLGKIQRPDTYPRCYCENCEHLRKVWEYGNVTIDDLTESSAGYICGYVTKKMTSKDDYRLQGRHPEFSRQSNGIAKSAALDIAEALKHEYGSLAFEFGDVPFKYLRGNTSVPLGRYMRTKIREHLGLEKINQETGEITYGTPFETVQKIREFHESEMCDLQNAIKAAPHGEKKPLFEKLDNMQRKKVSRRMQKVKNLETKNAIQQSKKEKKL